MHSWTKLLSKLAVTAIAVLALAIPAGAGAATVVNGDFETGSLNGWQVYNSTSAGNWFVFNAAQAVEEEVQPPIAGTYSAYTVEQFPDTAILYQDVALEPFYTHQLSLIAGYQSEAPIVAAPILAVDPNFPPSYDNQQMRIDVMKPTAPIESINPSDILATLFANKTGDPQAMAPTQFTADLSAFAGQTVRIRVVTAAGNSEFNTVLDNVSIASTPPNNTITRGKVVLNRKKGTGKLTINVPGPGTLHAVSKGKKKTIKIVNLTATAAGALKVPLNPNGAGRKALKNKGKLKAQLEVTFTPTGGVANTQIYKVTLKKTLPKKR